MGKRSRLQVAAEILSLCKEPQSKTRMLSRANLSWRMAKDYLYELQSNELLEVHHSPIKYVTTTKGLKFLEKWRELTTLL